jgi:peptidoglycan/xylan/chitin deacetylase (PgdA/CDA1 family)
VKSNEKSLFIRQLDYLKANYTVINLDINLELKPYIKYAAISFDDGYQNLIQNAIPELISKNFHSTIFIQTDYIGLRPGWDVRDDWQDGNEIVMSRGQIQNLPQEFICIGSHTKSHARVTSLSKEDLIVELKESKNVLENILKTKIDLFSFPYGSFDSQSIEIARETGYKRVFTTEPEIIMDMNNSFVYGRITVNPTDWIIEFKIKLAGGYSWVANKKI